MEEWRFYSFLIEFLIIQMETRLAPSPTILKAILQVVGFHLWREWPALPSATHRTMFTPTHGCICFAWQNEKYWELPGEIRQKILGDSGVLHIFPVTLVKRDFVWELDMGCSCRPFKYVLGLDWSGTIYPAKDSRMFEFNGQKGFLKVQTAPWI